MILLVHMLFGATMGLLISAPFLAIVVAFLSHYFLDLLPHIEYSIENIKKKQWNKTLPDILKVFLDFILGILIISVFSKNQLIIYACALSSIVPDGLTLLGYIFPKLTKAHDAFHQKVHFLKDKKISGAPINGSWRILTQLITVTISLFLIIKH